MSDKIDWSVKLKRLITALFLSLEDESNQFKTSIKWFDEKVDKWNPRLNSVLIILTIITIIAVLPSYFSPHVVQMETYSEYAPEDYLTEAGLDIPSYALKTTHVVQSKPQSYLWPSNKQTFFLPNDSYKIKVVQNDISQVTIDENEKKIIFEFLYPRPKVESTQLSFSYRQKHQPNVVILDYSMHISSNEIKEDFILENGENAKITSYRLNWMINNDEKVWDIENITVAPSKVVVDGEETDFQYSYKSFNDMEILIYSWDVNFEENEIKHIQIFSNTNILFHKEVHSVNAERFDHSFDPIFPYEEGTFEWMHLRTILADYPSLNESYYSNVYPVKYISFPMNKTIIEWNQEYQKL